MQAPFDTENQLNVSVSHKNYLSQTEPHTIEPHDVLQGVQVLDIGLVPAEDLGSGTEIIGEVLSIVLPHFSITTQQIDLLVKRNVVGWPVTFGKQRHKGR